LTSRSRRALTLAETGTENTSGNCGNENTRNNLNIVQQNLCKILILLIMKINNYGNDNIRSYYLPYTIPCNSRPM
jgi:hypothetical protein